MKDKVDCFDWEFYTAVKYIYSLAAGWKMRWSLGEKMEVYHWSKGKVRQTLNVRLSDLAHV